jgi:carbohydrate kinase (thermoresistant glucokinase family)
MSACTLGEAPEPVLVVMGVSGCGKSTVAALLAGRLGWPFAEGDDFHPPANVAKMHSGHPLDDEDRRPWLAELARWIDERLAEGSGGVVTCSALKRRYRDVLRREGVVFVYLHGTHDQIARRMAARHGHFMPVALLDSQFADLEEPGADENAIRVDIGDTPSQIADRILHRLHLAGEAST